MTRTFRFGDHRADTRRRRRHDGRVPPPQHRRRFDYSTPGAEFGFADRTHRAGSSSGPRPGRGWRVPGKRRCRCRSDTGLVASDAFARIIPVSRQECRVPTRLYPGRSIGTSAGNCSGGRERSAPAVVRRGGAEAAVERAAHGSKSPKRSEVPGWKPVRRQLLPASQSPSSPVRLGPPLGPPGARLGPPLGPPSGGPLDPW